MELYVSEDRRDELIRLGIPSSKQVSNGVIRMPTIGSASPNDVDRPNSQSDMVQSPQDTRPEQSGAFNGVNQGSTHTFDVSLRSATMRQPSVAQPATGQTILSARETQTHAPTNTDHDNRTFHLRCVSGTHGRSVCLITKMLTHRCP